MACACAAGALTLVTLSQDWRDRNTCQQPLQIKASSKDPTGYLFLSLDWNNKDPHFVDNDEGVSGGGGGISGSGSGGGSVGGVKIACSESKGSISVWDVETMEMESRWAAHELCGEPSEVTSHCWHIVK